jgi:8-oxo-dGTP pyrophosphatase MutT (NUDIX family)
MPSRGPPDYNRFVIEDDIVTAIGARLAFALAPPRAPLLALRIGSHAAGRIDAARAARLAQFDDVFAIDAGALRFVPGIDDEPRRTAALRPVARALATEGRLTAWRDERYAAAPEIGATPWFLLERAAARFFGIHTYAVHVNGLVQHGRDVAMWIARRAPTKAIDPGMLDNLAGGGIAAGQTIAATLIREAAEEAGIDALLVRQARPAGAVHIFREQPDGIQHETIFVHDLWLPESFVPVAVDGEIAGSALFSLNDAARIAANTQGTDVATADAGLVIADCLIRHGAIGPDAPAYLALEALRHPEGPGDRSGPA